jgi:E3 ubiquitin-protein ligase UBR2
MSQIMFRAVLQYCVKTLQTETDATVTDDIDHQEDIYCTIMYNDETHTFDQVISLIQTPFCNRQNYYKFQVIQTLTNVVHCTEKEAVEYVTSIDREGRAVVKCAPFEVCHTLKQDIEKRAMRTTLNPKVAPLKVSIFHKRAVACQTFAMQLLGWLQDFVALSPAFRSIFSEIVLQPSVPYNLKQILMYDIKLWKSARIAWHRLVIAGMLMEYESKKELAVTFTKVYTNIMQDFIRDDHFHTYSVVALSVQLFTVPTIAHHLIAHELAFFKLMHTYQSECIQAHVKNKVLQFQKNTSSMNVFKRASYIITDLKYLLTVKPDTWTQELRSGFLHGVQIVMRLLNCMQGMDAVTRQIGQHMEYEPEWESAFTLHIKLAPLISTIIEWCGTDKVVLVKVYRMVLTALVENKFIVSQVTHQVKELVDHSASCLMYDVSTKPVSIHLPLSRFLAGLYLHFEKFGLTFDNVSTTSDKPTPEQIIEPVLCTRVMISQVYSGMWRRNGYSLINQLYFYRNVKCRSEMLDRDIVLLQIAASLIENNEFLIHLLNKFELLRWLEPEFEPLNLNNSEEDNTRQIINMIDEFLELLIIVVGERYAPGIAKITDEDRVKKEVIQQLCIKSFSHSELNRSLNDDYIQENDFESVIDDVAVFENKSNAEKKRVYKLKEEFYEDYNMYFYHYTKEEKSKSEEQQRQRRKAKGELVCCPPPKLPVLSEPFR